MANIKPKLETKKITHTGLAKVNNRQHTLQYPPRMTNTIVTTTYQKIPTQRTNMHRHLPTRTNSHKLHHHRRNTKVVTNSTTIIVATPTSSSQHKGIQTPHNHPPKQTQKEATVRSHGHHGRQTGEPRKDDTTRILSNPNPNPNLTNPPQITPFDLLFSKLGRGGAPISTEYRACRHIARYQVVADNTMARIHMDWPLSPVNTTKEPQITPSEFFFTNLGRRGAPASTEYRACRHIARYQVVADNTMARIHMQLLAVIASEYQGTTNNTL